jgi:hypothetical protein
MDGSIDNRMNYRQYDSTMAERAKNLMNGGSQAVRLPEDRRLLLEPADEWSSEFVSALGGWDGDLERPRAKAISTKNDPFE